MLKRMTVAALAVLAGVAGAHAQNQTEVVIQYPYPELFTETHKKIAEEFTKVRPDIKVTMRAPYESYEDGTQRVLREAVTSQMPDVSFQGLNRIRVLVDKNIPAPLDGYIAEEKDFDKQGFHQAMFDIGTSSGKIYALPFAISLPIVYVNLDLAKKAGADPENLPTTWDGIIDLAKKIKASAPDVNGVTYVWDITGNWLWQAPVFSRGGSMLNADETKVAFNGAEGQFAIRMLARLVSEGGMPNLDQPAMRAAFAAGKTGIHVTSTSDLNKVTQMVGDKFALKPVCAGPYRFVERIQQDRIVVEKFANYWNKDQVFIDKITYLPGLRRQHRPVARRRQRRDDPRQGQAEARRFLGSGEVLDRTQGCGDHGRNHRLYAPQQGHQRRLSEGLLRQEPEQLHRGQATAAADQVVRVPRR